MNHARIAAALCIAASSLSCAASRQPQSFERYADDMITRSTQRRVEIHEAGHFIVGKILRPGVPVTAVVVRTRWREKEAYGLTFHQTIRKFDTAQEIINEVVEDLAGREAELVILGQETDGGTTDLENANKRLRLLCFDSGLCGSLIVGGPSTAAREAMLERCLRAAKMRAHAIIANNSAAIRDFAELIQQQPVRRHIRTIRKAQLRQFLKTHSLIDETAAPMESCS